MTDIGMHQRPYDPDVRATLCTSCGAPFEVGKDGGSVACPACGAVNVLPPRDLRPVRFEVSLAEDERLARLRTQDGKPLLPPPGLEEMAKGDDLSDWKVDEARVAWQDARREARATGRPEAEGRLAFLTLLLQNKKSGKPDRFRNRAFLESCLEAVVSPRYRQEYLARLSRSAGKAGDLRSAERWLELCDPHPDVLAADSDWRVSRAYIDAQRRDWAAVLRALGEKEDDVPIEDSLDNLAGTLRAHALERSGRLDEAVEQLVVRMKRLGDRRRVEQILTSTHWCEAARPIAVARVEQACAQDAADRGGGSAARVSFIVAAILLVPFLVWFTLALLDYLGRLDLFDAPPGDLAVFWSWGFGAPMFLVFGLGFLVSGGRTLWRARAARQLRLHGIPMKAQVREISETNQTVNGVPVWCVELTVRPKERPPYDASTKLLLGADAAEALKPGTTVHVRVDAKDPSRVLIETYS